MFLMRLFQVGLFVLCFQLVTVGQGLTPKQMKGKWGYVNSAGEWIIKAKFIQAKEFHENLAAVQKGKKWGYINSAGKFVVKPLFGYATDFSEGKAAVLSLKVLQGTTKADYLKQKWGFINTSGELIIPYTFRNVNPFKKGIALVANWGQHEKELYMINESGKSISPPFIGKRQYAEDVLKLSNVRKEGDSVYCYVKNNGDKITEWYLNNFEFKDFPVKVYRPSDVDNHTKPANAFEGDPKVKVCAMMNKTGKLFTPWYTEIMPFSKGFAPVRYNHLWGFVDSSYEYVTQPVYRDIEFLKEGFYNADKDVLRSVLVNEKGRAISHEVENVAVFNDTFFVSRMTLKSNDKERYYYALLDSLGDQRTGWYNKIHPFENGISRVEETRLYRVKKDSIDYGNWYNYVVDSTGEILCFWRYGTTTTWDGSKRKYRDSVLNYLFAPKVNYHLTEEYFREVYLKDFAFDKRKGIMNFNGGNFSEGMALVSKKMKNNTCTIGELEFEEEVVRYGYVDWYGDLVIPYKYKEAGSFTNGKAIISDGKSYGAIDYKGRVIIKPQYQLMGNFGSGLAPVFKDSTWGYVNSKNKLVLDYQYEDVRPYKFGYAAVKKGKNWALIDTFGNIVLDYNYRKPPKMISRNVVEVLKKGVGYVKMELNGS